MNSFSPLHELYHARAFDRFVAHLSPPRKSTGAAILSKSPKWDTGASQEKLLVEINRRDWAGRTLLHLVASSAEPDSYKWAEVLTKCHNLNINIQDYESGWTALHRSVSFTS
jgi:hypothetical protein